MKVLKIKLIYIYVIANKKNIFSIYEEKYK